MDVSGSEEKNPSRAGQMALAISCILQGSRIASPTTVAASDDGGAREAEF